MPRFLLTPGPVEVPQDVLYRSARPLISHRCGEFYDLFISIENKLHKLLESERKVVILPSSGTGALECAAVNFLSHGDKFISASCGVFGSRFREIALRTGADGVFIDAELGSAPSADEVARVVRENEGASVLILTQNETSTGVTVPVRDIIAALPEKNRPLVVIDGVSSVGAIECFPEKWGIDVLCTASQKGLLTPPGLGLLWLSERAEAELCKRSCSSYYFDLKLHLKNMKPEAFGNPYTPPVTLYYALDSALDVILRHNNWFAARRAFADAFMAGIEELGYVPFVKEKNLRSAGVSAFSAPDGNNEEIRRKLSARGFETAGGQAALKGKIIRSAHYSDWNFDDLRAILAAFAEAVNCDKAACIEKAKSCFRWS